jgi:hypothetical protein
MASIESLLNMRGLSLAVRNRRSVEEALPVRFEKVRKGMQHLNVRREMELQWRLTLA